MMDDATASAKKSRSVWNHDGYNKTARCRPPAPVPDLMLFATMAPSAGERDMGATHKGEMSASMAVLGILARAPDTLAGVGRHLAREFPRARFARSVVHNSLSSLERQGLVRVTEKGRERSLDRYCVTEQGRDSFRKWLRDFSALTPVVRDGLNAKLAFADPEDLPPLLAAVRAAQRACAQEYATAHARFLAARVANGGRDDGWSVELQRAMIGDEVTMWLFHVKRLQRLHAILEPLSRAVGGDAGGGEKTDLVADATVI